MDDLDLNILQALQKDGRRKNADLAREFGVAPSTMLERINRLEARGFLQGYRAVIDPKSMGLRVQSFVAVSFVQLIADQIKTFEQCVQALPNVMAGYHVSGGFDYILHVMATDLEHLGKLVKEQIAAIPGVGRTETFLVFSEIKADQGYPVELIERNGAGSADCADDTNDQDKRGAKLCARRK